ncbi:hypothetical protein AB1Y20_016119 [Prymnesium parvum]|uniref:Uncharacterized protein n=1 Tax=Prymnesium parvum TaxID=97485 RepID=A0AB34K4Z7_PRYPA
MGSAPRGSPSQRCSAPRKGDAAGGHVTKTPAGSQPPFITKRSLRQLSREERGASTSEDEEESRLLSESPIPARRLFHERKLHTDGFQRREAVRLCVVLLLVLVSICAWAPVIAHLIGWPAAAAQGSHAARRAVHETSTVQAQPLGIAYVFHEPGCAGESLKLTHSMDLCWLRYNSGIDAKDNVASVLLVPEQHPGIEALVYGTCALTELPENPMLLEIIRAEGCTDLKYPICGRLELRAAVAPENARRD